MRKYHEVLINSYMKGDAYKKVGNHKLEISEDGLAKFKYHDNTIIKINEDEKVIYVDNCGWDTVSTNQAINGYIYNLTSILGDYEVIKLN